jgi:hypothetical protein
MNKEISVERTFQFVQYEPLKFTDTITEIPDTVASNPDAMKLLRYLQLVDIEWSWLSYMELRLAEPKLANAEAVKQAKEFMEAERTVTFEKLLQTIRENKPSIVPLDNRPLDHNK